MDTTTQEWKRQTVKSPRGPFQGVRVLDLTEGIAGAVTTMLFNDYGAEVVKVEPPGGDRLRDDPAFRVLHRGKRGIVFDRDSREQLAHWPRLLLGADVVVTSGPDLSQALGGLEPEALRFDHPGLIVAHTPTYGTVGSLAAVPEDEMLLAALSGWSCHQITYEPGPAWFPSPVAGVAHGLLTAVAIGAALVERQASGYGQVVEIPGVRCCHEYQLGGFIFSDQLPVRSSRAQKMSPRLLFGSHGYFAGSDDKWFFVGAVTSAQWIRLAAALDRYDLLSDERLAAGPMFVADDDAFETAHSELERTFASAPRDHWLGVLRDSDIPVAPLARREEFLVEEQVQSLELATTVEDPEVGPVTAFGLPIFFDETPGWISGAAPALDPEAPWPDWDRRPSRAQPGERAAGTAPLSGVQVLDVGSYISGPLAATILADLGAEVIKVEPPGGDPWRAIELGFLGWNRGKRSVVLDLNDESDQARFDQLVARADVVINNNRAVVSKKLGMDPRHLLELNPRLVAVTISANGPTGPLASDPAYDQVLQARSGLSDQQAGGQEPIILSMAPNDHSSGALGAWASLAGLYARSFIGRGQHAETSLLQAAMVIGAGDLAFYPGRPPHPRGGRDRRGRSASDRAYRCSDGRWIYIQLRSGREWHALLGCLSGADWSQPWPWESVALEAPDGKLADHLADAFASQVRDAIVERLINAGVTCVPCLDLEEVFEHPHMVSNCPSVLFEHPKFGHIRLPGCFALYSDTPISVSSLAPTLGEHTVEVLSELAEIRTPRREHQRRSTR